MDKLNEELLVKIEQVLKIKFHPWQANYILNKPMVLDMNITRRGSGKTLAYVIKLLFSDETPIRAFNTSEMAYLSDDYHLVHHNGPKDDSYTHWFRNYMTEIYWLLLKNNIKPRPVFLTRVQESIYESEKRKEMLFDNAKSISIQRNK